MTVVTRLEAEQAFLIAKRRTWAVEVLAAPHRSASLFTVLVSVTCVAATAAFLALRTGPDSRAVVGAAAGGALALAGLAYGELRRLRRRVAALETLALRDGV